MDVWKHDKPESEQKQPLDAGVHRITLAETVLPPLDDIKEVGFLEKHGEEQGPRLLHIRVQFSLHSNAPKRDL